jgi:hypothetical protein
MGLRRRKGIGIFCKKIQGVTECDFWLMVCTYSQIFLTRSGRILKENKREEYYW